VNDGIAHFQCSASDIMPLTVGTLETHRAVTNDPAGITSRTCPETLASVRKFKDVVVFRIEPNGSPVESSLLRESLSSAPLSGSESPEEPTSPEQLATARMIENNATILKDFENMEGSCATYQRDPGHIHAPTFPHFSRHILNKLFQSLIVFRSSLSTI